MKITISQKVLLHAIECGGASALLEDAQKDISNLSLLVKSIKITVDKDFIIESSNKMISSKYIIPITDGCGIDVRETGSIVIPAKEFLTWVSKQGNSKIGIVFAKTDQALTNDDEKVKIIGVAKFQSKDSTGTGSRWSLDCYDPLQITLVDFSQKPNMLFETDTSQIIDAIKYVSISSMERHAEHIYDSLLFETCKDTLYIAATDTTRCSVYKVDKDVILSDRMKDGKEKIRLMVPGNLLEMIAKKFENVGKMSFYYDDIRNRVFITQPNFEFRVTTVDKDVSKKFPVVEALLNKKYENLCLVDRSALVNRIATISIVNKNTALFKFRKEDGNLLIKAISENGLAPSMAVVPAKDISKDKKFVFAINHLIDVMKVLKEDNISINTPPSDNNSFKIVSEVDPNFFFFGMTVTNSKYNLDED